MKHQFITFIILSLTTMSAVAQDRVFTNVYQTNVLPAGIKDIEYQLQHHTGRSSFYNSYTQRFEFEVGLGGNVQTSLYLNMKTTVTLDTTANAINRCNEFGFSSEFKWKLSDPTNNKIGSALYAEIGSNGDEWELEAKILLDKQMSKHLLALNLVEEVGAETEVVGDEVKRKMEYPVKIDFGYMYELCKHAGLGLEAKNFNDISGDAGWESTLLFAGPVLNFHGDGWFINVSCMPQLHNLKRTDEFPDALDLTEHEKINTNVILSFTF
ncbi:MAG: hypothetical protein WCI97_04525 [Bacteroidota bacterium]